MICDRAFPQPRENSRLKLRVATLERRLRELQAALSRFHPPPAKR
ncbi:MAG: hypothetical protein QXO51_04825 [Halobacteria archaeon]